MGKIPIHRMLSSGAKRLKATDEHREAVHFSNFSALASELHKKILVWCDGGSLAMLELSCKAFAPPAPRLSLVQEIVRETMQNRFPGAQLGVKSWPSLLQRHEQAAEAAEQWEPPADDPDSDDEEEELICETLCDE